MDQYYQESIFDREQLAVRSKEQLLYFVFQKLQMYQVENRNNVDYKSILGIIFDCKQLVGYAHGQSNMAPPSQVYLMLKLQKQGITNMENEVQQQKDKKATDLIFAFQILNLISNDQNHKDVWGQIRRKFVLFCFSFLLLYRSKLLLIFNFI